MASAYTAVGTKANANSGKATSQKTSTGSIRRATTGNFNLGTKDDPLPNVGVPQPTLYSTADLGNMYNITYDENVIRNKFNDATRAEYVTKNQEYRNTENQYANNLYTAQRSQTDSIRKAMAQGLASGTDASTAILSAMTGMQQEGATGATELSNARNLLKAQEAEAYTTNAKNALEYANELGMGLGELSNLIFGNDVINAGNVMGYNATLDANAKTKWAAKYAADKNYTIAGNQLTNNSLGW